MLSENQKLDVLAMVLADMVYTDRTTGRNTILGTYTGISGANFPYLHPVLVVYFAFTGGEGTTEIKFRLIDGEESRPVFEGKSVVQFAEATQILDGVCASSNVLFPKPGLYRLQVLIGDRLIKERLVPVFAAPK